MLKEKTKIISISKSDYILIPSHISKDSSFPFKKEDNLTIEIKNKKLLVRKSILLLILFMSLPIALADLTIEPQSISTIVYANYETIILVKLTNTFNFTIYNINFSNPSNEFTFPEISSLESNESRDIEIKINTNSAYGATTKYSTIKFKYYTAIEDEPEYHNISIFEIYFSPTPITIEKGDYVRFSNKGVLTHTVTSSNPYFEKVIPSNSSEIVNVFNEVMYVDYYDKDILFHGYIDVINKSQELTYNQDYDKEMTFIITSRYNETTMELSIPIDNLTLEYDAKTEEILQIKNIGNYKIINVSLTANKWISFEENNFDVSSGSNNYVLFTIDPHITDVVDTNKTHEITIKAKGINSEEVSKSILLFVPYEDKLEDFTNYSRDELIKKVEELQKIIEQYLTKLNLGINPDCPENKPYWSILEKRCMDKDEISQYLIQYNYTQEDIATMLTKIAEAKDISKTLIDYTKPKLDTIESNILETIIPLIKEAISIGNKSYEMAKSNEETIERGKTLRWTFGTITILLILTGVAIGLIKYKKYREKQY